MKGRGLLTSSGMVFVLIALMVLTLILILTRSQVVTAATNQPRLQVSNYTVEPEIAVAGKSFELVITIENVGERDAHGINVTLASVEGQPTLQFFSPLGRGNYFFIDEIEEDESRDEIIKMTTNDKIESGTYNLVLNFTYESSGGQEYQGTEIIGVTVLREPIIKIEGLKHPTEIKQFKTGEENDEPKIVANVVNASDFVVNAVSVSLSGDLEVIESSYYIGNLEGGGFDAYETEIKDLEPGKYKEKLKVTYRNDFGEEEQVTEEFIVKVKGETTKDEEPKGLWASIVNFFKALLGIGN